MIEDAGFVVDPHVAWWLSHCDSLLEISSLSGAEDAATIAHEAGESRFVDRQRHEETGSATDLSRTRLCLGSLQTITG